MYESNRLKFGGVQYIVWQEDDQAIVITRYRGSVVIRQKDAAISIEDENFAEVMKLLREAGKSEMSISASSDTAPTTTKMGRGSDTVPP